MSDYDVAAALAAKEAGDGNYFYNELPSPTVNTGIVSDAPVPPSERNWLEVPYPTIPAGFVGQPARDVLVTPSFPLDVPWSDPNPSTNVAAAYVDLAPDSSVSIEIRYTPGQSPQYVDAYIPLIPGRRHVGVRFEVWTKAGFDHGLPLTGGKIGGGLWGGGRPATGDIEPWQQGGISWRNVWGAVTGAVNLRGHAHVLNRTATEGLATARIPGLIVPGQWQSFEYEGILNSPGFADGEARMWVDGTCVAEVTGAVWAIDEEWFWRGIIISDAWQDGDVPQAQERWLRNLALYHPTVNTGYGNAVDGYVELGDANFNLVERTSLGIGVSVPVNSGDAVVQFANVGVAPTSLGFTGGILYVQSGALFYRDATIASQLAPS